MPIDQNTYLSLNTDDAPDQAGQQLIEAENLRPVSARGVRPREGTSLVGHYDTGLIGRPICADALPGGEGDGILLVATHVEPDGAGGSDEEVHGLFDFYPPQVASAYSAVAGLGFADTLYAVVAGAIADAYNPTSIPLAGTAGAAFAGATEDYNLDSYPVASLLLGGLRTFAAAIATERAQILAVMTIIAPASGENFQTVRVDTFNPATGARIAGVLETTALHGFASAGIDAASAGRYGGLSLLPGRAAGYVGWFGDGTVVRIFARLNSVNYDQTAILHEVMPELIETGIIAGVSPLSHTAALLVLVAKAGATSGETQLALVRITSPLVYDPSGIQGLNAFDGFMWVDTSQGTDEFKCLATGSGDAGVAEPAYLRMGGVLATRGTMGSLNPGEWDYGDPDSDGFDSINVRLPTFLPSADPDDVDGTYTIEAIPSADALAGLIVWEKEFVQASFAGWPDRPDTCIWAQRFPAGPLAAQIGDSTLALLGNLSQTCPFRMRVTAPRLARVSMGSGASAPGDVLASAIAGSQSPAAFAYDIAVSHFGRVFVSGLAFQDNDTLIAAYDAHNLTGEPLARVAFGENGLGDGWASQELTRVHTLIWVGNRLLAVDEDLDEARIFVFDEDLVFIRKFTLSASQDGPVLDLKAAAYRWTVSSLGSGAAYFLELADGGDPGIAKPRAVFADEAIMTEAADTTELQAGESWWHGDADGHGWDTIYMNLNGSSDPDGEAEALRAVYGTRAPGLKGSHEFLNRLY